MNEINTKEVYLAGGCFWGLQKYIDEIHGIIKTEVGYANGKTENPTYDEVCRKDTGHAEAVWVEYNPEVISLARILELYYRVINPTSLNRQGNDVGSQYRTGIYFVDEKDEEVIKASILELQKGYDKPIAIEVVPLNNYYRAEEYHQKYLDKNPGGYCHIGPQHFNMAKDVLVDPYQYDKVPDEYLKEVLTPMQYNVSIFSGTEPPYNNKYWNRFEEGLYVDITTGEPLFTSKDKFESSCGWPSFSKPIDAEVVRSKKDASHGMLRQEVRSRVGDIHLGHVFEDGPKESGGLRYCINSASLRFIPKNQMEEEGYGQYLSLLEG